MEKIRYGLKLWSNNTGSVADVVAAHRAGHFDFVELYSDPTKEPDYSALEALKAMPVTIHATHSHGFHEFIIGEEQETLWGQTVHLADFFNSSIIVLHPGRSHTIDSFRENLERIDDPRIYIENMAGLDIDHNPMFGQLIEDLKKLHEIKPICFDLEKAVKAACYQGLDYKEYIQRCLDALSPTYFHISGGDKDSAVDQHLNLWEGDFDLKWMREKVGERGARLVFETPKNEGITNDLKNMAYFTDL